MAVLRWIRKFDEGVEKARKKYHAGSASAFDEEFAAFTIYDTTAAEETISTPRFMLVPTDRPHHQPELWKHLHRPLGQILRNDPDLAPLYAGFATLFTLNRGSEATRSATNYLSMSIDAPLSAPGMQELELTRLQFNGPVGTRPLPLTAACLNATGDSGFHTTPIVFYWRSPDNPMDVPWGSIPEGLETWGHVFLSALIPEDEKFGLKKEPHQWGLDGSLQIPENTKAVFGRSDLHTRLKAYYNGLKKNPEDPTTLAAADLERRLAWTVTYFAYACRRNAEAGLLPKGQKASQFNNLAIVCAPASGSIVNSALYLPLACEPGNPEFPRAALKALYLARTVGMPLERLRWEKDATEQGIRDTLDRIRHQTSATIDSVVEEFQYLPESVREALGGHLLARIYLLRATIHAYNRYDRLVFASTFSYPWGSDSPLKVYCEIGLQLGLGRALRASEDDVELRAQDAFSRLRTLGDQGLKVLVGEYFDFDSDIKHFEEAEGLEKNEAFAVLVLLVIKQAVYHTIRAQCRGASGRVHLKVLRKLSHSTLSWKVRNPTVDERAPKSAPRDVEELVELAEFFSRRGRYVYSVTGPTQDSAGWEAEVSFSWALS